jgi:hypothetical protein
MRRLIGYVVEIEPCSDSNHSLQLLVVVELERIVRRRLRWVKMGPEVPLFLKSPFRRCCLSTYVLACEDLSVQLLIKL